MVDEWKVFLRRCIASRIPPDVFAAAVAQLHAKSPLPGRKLAALVLLPRAAGIDPRSIAILEQLLALKKVDASDVLTVTFLHSKDRRPINTGDEKTAKDAQWSNPPELEEIIFHRLHKAFASEERPVNNAEGLRTLVVVTRWMQAMVTSHTSDTMIQAMAGIQQPHQQSINAREGLAMLVIGVVENPKILAILSNPKGKGELSHFDLLPTISLSVHMHHKSSACPSATHTYIQIFERTLFSRCPHSFLSSTTTRPDRKRLCH